MKIMLTGGKGMLGRTLCRELKNFDIIATDLPEADITDAAAFEKILQKNSPAAVIHCAAMTAVDRCETESDQAYSINATGTANVARACHSNHIRLIAISTDYVFDGDSPRPYNEHDSATGGKTIYGKSKFAGEEAVRLCCPDHVICRLAWLYGPGGPSFVHTMMSLADGTRPELKIVSDQTGNPTSTLAVAEKLQDILLRRELTGTFHLTCEGEATWAEFAGEIFRIAGKKQKIRPCTTKDYPRPAPRPANSCLDNMMLRRAGLPPMPHWKEALREFMQQEFQIF